MMTPTELRQYAELAHNDAEDWKAMADQFPQRRDQYLAKAEQRQDDERFYLEKADRDEAWNGTEETYLEAAE